MSRGVPDLKYQNFRRPRRGLSSRSSSDLLAPATQLAGSGTSPGMSETPLGRRKSSDDGVARSKGALENRRLKAERIILPREAGATVRASASILVDVNNCLFHALARTYAHFFISILYVNFQFGSNEYILIVWHSSSLAAKLLRRVTRAKPDVYSYTGTELVFSARI